MRARRAIGFSLDISKVFFPFSSLFLMIHLFGGYTVGNGAMKGKEPLGTVGIRGIVEIGWGNFIRFFGFSSITSVVSTDVSRCSFGVYKSAGA